MADLVKFTIDGRELEAPAGTLVIEAARQNGIEIPSFCYYEGYSLQAACRMCLVEVERMPKMQVACTLPVMANMVVKTDTEQVRNARKYTLEFLLSNHPLDCPVCDKGGECELQDMVFRYGAGESRFTETKIHVDEQQWSPVVFYDAPRCILCFRCVRACDEGMGVGALGVVNRGAMSLIAPNHGDHLECDECGQCIDICPVGALTATKPVRGKWITLAPSAPIVRTAARPHSAFEATKSFAATTGTGPASMASSCAPRVATHSIFTTTPTVSNLH